MVKLIQCGTSLHVPYDLQSWPVGGKSVFLFYFIMQSHGTGISNIKKLMSSLVFNGVAVDSQLCPCDGGQGIYSLCTFVALSAEKI